jgi:hypothetical protein
MHAEFSVRRRVRRVVLFSLLIALPKNASIRRTLRLARRRKPLFPMVLHLTQKLARVLVDFLLLTTRMTNLETRMTRDAHLLA